jgi:hypothetical protein
VVTSAATSSAFAIDGKRNIPLKPMNPAAKLFRNFLDKQCVDVVNTGFQSGNASL